MVKPSYQHESWSINHQDRGPLILPILHAPTSSTTKSSSNYPNHPPWSGSHNQPLVASATPPGARCMSCKCSREERPCVNCYPGRRGKCANIAPSNAVILPASPPRPEALLQSNSSHSLPSEQGTIFTAIHTLDAFASESALSHG